ncbi:MAG: glycosyltransferase family 2 protein [Candidatus Brocadiaceae bacterium]|nr:glycosyltransferase family 2 protein [Candidatus Brocadiaceae bacterium]
MIVVFILSVSILLYIFCGYPIILAALCVLFGKRVSKEEIYPHVSLIISAYNEEGVIRQKIENSLVLDYPKELLEIIVASESIDNTNAIVKEYMGVGVILRAFCVREGKPATLYKVVPEANGEIIVFSDANAMYEKDAIKKLVRNFNDRRIGCVSGRLQYTNPSEASAGKGESVYWDYEVILKKMLSKLYVLGGGANGSIFAIRKKLYNPINKYCGDDLELSGRIEIAGYGVVLETDAISYEDTSENIKQEFKRKVRLATWNLRSSLLIINEAVIKGKLLTAFTYFSHRFLRYTTPLWLVLLFISNIFLLNDKLIYSFYLQSVFYCIAFLGFIMEKTGRKMHTLFLVPLYFCMVNYAAMLALAKNAIGKTEMLWEKAR